MDKRTRYSPEVQERAVRLVQEHAPEYPSQWAAIRSIAGKVGRTAEALRRWVRRAKRGAGRRPGLTTDEQRAGEPAVNLRVDDRTTRGRAFYLRSETGCCCPPCRSPSRARAATS